MKTARRTLSNGERRSLLVVYDVLHYLSLHGPRVRREEVVEYLHRATSRRETPEGSRLRAFERFKQKLRALGISYESEGHPSIGTGEVHFTIRGPEAAKTAVSALLDANRTEKHEGKDAA